jgi:2-phosphosulfolactate phosphatase
MRVHVAFTPAEAVESPLAVVVDVLRATSTITQALASGYHSVLCCTEIEQARELAARQPSAVLGGERRCLPIPGFDCGNSPSEYAGEPAAETLVLSTTNGTKLLVAAAERSERVLVASMLNLAAVVGAVQGDPSDEVAILCAGVRGELCLDDAYVAGRIAEQLDGAETDSAVAAIRLARSFATPYEGLAASQSARNLLSAGLPEDIEWCARESVVDVVPRLAGMVGPAARVTLAGAGGSRTGVGRRRR